MSYHYSQPPPGYVLYSDGYTTSTSTSPTPDNPAYDYYHPYQSPAGSPSATRATPRRQHVRTASYSTPRVGGWHSPTGYPSPGYQNMSYTAAPLAGYEKVSRASSSRIKTKARPYSMSGQSHGAEAGHYYVAGEPVYHHTRRASARSSSQRIFVDVTEEAYDRDHVEPVYINIAPRAAARSHSTSRYGKADQAFVYSQAPVYDQPAEALPRSRTRRSSTTSRPKTSSGSSSPKSKGLKMPPEATAADAASHQIPAGYSLKNWDPTEKPILLLGSVFDANSLGKWVYDWTVYHHKAGSPLTEVAGELWLLLIKFSGKLKRADAAYARLRHRDDRELVHDFLASGERIWRKVTDLLKRCEEYMWRAARHDGARGKLQMGEKSGIEFVRTIFGRERELEMTEKLMQSVRLWSMRFDANCEDIVYRKDH